MDISIFSNPVKIGPGIWFKMHSDGVKAINDELKRAFEINVNYTCDNFKCKTCQPHFRKFIDTHPFKNYWNIHDIKGRDIGFFKWTWELHNQVNKFLNKYQPTLEEAYDFFNDTEAGACFNCSGQNNITNNPTNIITNNAINNFTNNSINNHINEQVSRPIPEILTLYREGGDIQPKPFKLIVRDRIK